MNTGVHALSPEELRIDERLSPCVGSLPEDWRNYEHFLVQGTRTVDELPEGYVFIKTSSPWGESRIRRSNDHYTELLAPKGHTAEDVVRDLVPSFEGQSFSVRRYGSRNSEAEK